MSKSVSRDRIDRTQQLTNRQDISALAELDRNISANLLQTLTVIDTEDLPKIKAIQQSLQQENSVRNLIEANVNTYNQLFEEYQSTNNKIASHGTWSLHPNPKTTWLSSKDQNRYDALYDQAVVLDTRMRTILDVTPARLDINMIPPGVWALNALRARRTNLATRATARTTLVGDVERFDVDAAINPLEWAWRIIANDFFKFWQTTGVVATYGFYDANSVPLSSHSLPWLLGSYYQIQFEHNGARRAWYVQNTAISINNANWEVTIAPNVQIFDSWGNDITPDTSYQIAMRAGADMNLAAMHWGDTNFTGGGWLHLLNVKDIIIERNVSENMSRRVLRNPAFIDDLESSLRYTHDREIWEMRARWGVLYATALENSDSVLNQVFEDYLTQNEQYDSLSGREKLHLKQELARMTSVHAVRPDGTSWLQQMFGVFWRTIVDAAWQLSVYNHNAWALVVFDEAFERYMQSDEADPQPSNEDRQNEVRYRTWLMNNIRTLMKNYYRYVLDWYLQNTVVVQWYNQLITSFFSQREQDKVDYERDPVAHNNAAAAALDAALPRRFSRRRNNGHDRWTRLMVWHSASVSDEVKVENWDDFSYEIESSFSRSPSVQTIIKIDGGDELIYHAQTPGQLLARILRGWGGRLGGQKQRMQIAFGVMKSLIKSCKEAWVYMTVPVDWSWGDEYRVSLSWEDKLKVERFDFDSATNEFHRNEATPRQSFDEHEMPDGQRLTGGFLVWTNDILNRMMDRQYASFRDTMNDSTNMARRFGRIMMWDRERMSYRAQPRLLRWLLTKWINRKQPDVDEFSFNVESGWKSLQISYHPSGEITIEGEDGQRRSGKRLWRLLNPKNMNWFWWVFNNRKNFTDWFELPILQWLYDNLSKQLMKNEKVNQYTYLVRDPRGQRMYAMYLDGNDTPKLGVFENHAAAQWLVMRGRRRWRLRWFPTHAIRELGEAEQQSVMWRPEIMDGFIQNMLKAREEIMRISTWRARGLSMNASNVSRGLGAALLGIGGVKAYGFWKALLT